MINFKKLFHNIFQTTSIFSYQSLKSLLVALCFNMLSSLKFYLLKSYILASIFVYENPVKVGFVIWLTIYYILYKSYTIYNFFKKIIIASVDYKDLNDFFQDHSNTLDLGQPVFIFNREDGLLKDKLDALIPPAPFNNNEVSELTDSFFENIKNRVQELAVEASSSNTLLAVIPVVKFLFLMGGITGVSILTYKYYQYFNYKNVVISETPDIRQIPAEVLEHLNVATESVLNNPGTAVGIGVGTGIGNLNVPTENVLNNPGTDVGIGVGTVHLPSNTNIIPIPRNVVTSVQYINKSLSGRKDIIPIFEYGIKTAVRVSEKTYMDLLNKVHKSVSIEEQCSLITHFVKNTVQAENPHMNREDLDYLIISTYSKVFYKTIYEVNTLSRDTWALQKQKVLENILIEVKSKFIRSLTFSDETITVDHLSPDYTNLKIKQYSDCLKSHMKVNNKELFDHIYEPYTTYDAEFFKMKTYTGKNYVFNSDFEVDFLESYKLKEISKVLYFSYSLQNLKIKESSLINIIKYRALSRFEETEWGLLKNEKKKMELCLRETPTEDIVNTLESLSVKPLTIKYLMEHFDIDTFVNILSCLP
jgi:hypothetical protein